MSIISFSRDPHDRAVILPQADWDLLLSTFAFEQRGQITNIVTSIREQLATPMEPEVQAKTVVVDLHDGTKTELKATNFFTEGANLNVFDKEDIVALYAEGVWASISYQSQEEAGDDPASS